MPNHRDLTGFRKGRLTAVRPVGLDKDRHHVMWECRCDCGNVIRLASSALTSGETYSCGCLRKELARNKISLAQAAAGYIDGTAISMLSGDKPFTSGTSGYRGVSWNKAAKKFSAQITFKRKKYHLGLFDSAEEAHDAYLSAKKRLHTAFVESNGGKMTTYETILRAYRLRKTLRGAAEEAGVSPSTVRRVLITAGLYTSQTTDRIRELSAAGMPTADIAEMLHMTSNAIINHMPYSHGCRADWPETENARRIRECRARKEK